MTLKQRIHRLKVRFRWIERKKRRVSYAPQSSQEEHTCQHCGTQFQGNYCPQCGKVASWQRLTFKRLCLNFLDIWGLGNRPMVRTIRDLFWRPGYMIQDYLNGHSLSYFPPFKMLAVFTIFIIFLAWCFDINYQGSGLSFKSIEAELGANSKHLLAYLQAAIKFLNEHLLYTIILQNVLVVLITWLVFKKKSKLNLVETFFSQIYINCQFHIITIVLILITQSLPDIVVYPYMVPFWLVFIMLIYDYRQLYGLKTWSVVWRILLISFLLILTYFILIIAVVVIIAIVGSLM